MSSHNNDGNNPIQGVFIPVMTKPEPTPFLDADSAAQYLRLRKSTLERWRCMGRGPTFYKFAGRCMYKKEDLDAFANRHRRRSTSDPGPAPRRNEEGHDSGQ